VNSRLLGTFPSDLSHDVPSLSSSFPDERESGEDTRTKSSSTTLVSTTATGARERDGTT